MLLVNPVLEKAFIIKYLCVYPPFCHMVKIIFLLTSLFSEMPYTKTQVKV